MGAQVEGIVGWGVDRMIRRSLRRSFRNLYWLPPAAPIPEPAVFVANHHGWHDGYVMYVALSALRLRGFHDWIQEYDAFPPFGKVGGMPFPAGDAARRAATIRRTIRLMRDGKRSLLLFAEGILHRPPELLPFGKSLEMIASHVPGLTVVPVAIRYELNVHERPEVFVLFGEPVTAPPATDVAGMGARTRLSVAALLDRIAATLVLNPDTFQCLAAGTLDVNERWDMRKIRGFPARSGESQS